MRIFFLLTLFVTMPAIVLGVMWGLIYLLTWVQFALLIWG
jgi:hypothetical protein